MSKQAEQRNYDLFEHALISPLEGRELPATDRYVADLLLCATPKAPLSIKELIRKVTEAAILKAVPGLTRGLTDREIKALIRRLRRDHAFPILSRRRKPSGYWWCSSVTEMKSFIKTFRSQALDELATLSKIVRHNYPELAGQLTIEDALLGAALGPHASSVPSPPIPEPKENPHG